MNFFDMFSQLKQFLVNSGKNYDIALITRAFEYASQLHEGQYRRSGEEYICHPIAVAQICANLGYDTDSICAALLHDVVEDCPDKTNLDEVKKLFGDSIASLVDGLTKLKAIHFSSKDEETVQNLRKMFFAMSDDTRVMLIKLCDRLHNMRTIGAMTEEKKREIGLETMYVFAPVAHMLGIYKIKEELEDIGLQCLDSLGYKEVKDAIEVRYGESRDLIDKSQEKIKEVLLADNIKVTIEGRIKTIKSIYDKMFKAKKSFDAIYDFYAIRVIVNDLTEVYHVLGIIHDLFSYREDRFKDYISTPKKNGYQSIHTTVVNDKGIPFEVQIRTKEMHEMAEYGDASHWKYKMGEKLPEKFKWLRTLLETEYDPNNPEETLTQIRMHLYENEVFVFTPKGHLKSLPIGSTLIDFAYSIHTAIGNKIVGAKINRVIASIDTVLENNQIVEILTSNNSPGPSRDWLKIVKTGEAKNKIRQWFKKENRADNILYGTQEIEKIFRQFNKYALTESQKTEILTLLLKRDGFASLDDFYNAIGYGGVDIKKLTPRVKLEVEKLFPEEIDKNLIIGISQIPLTEHVERSYNSDIIVDGLDNCYIKFAKCCNPLPGDSIAGFMTKGHGMSIHKEDCSNYLTLKSQDNIEGRIFTVAWNLSKTREDYAKPQKGFKAFLKIEAVNDEIYLFSALSAELAAMKVAVHSINKSKVKSDDTVIIDLIISAWDADHLDYIIGRLKKLKNVNSADRGYFV